MTYESLYVDAGGRTSRGHFVGALVPLLAAFAFYRFVVPNALAGWYVPVLLVPAFVLHARRLHDMGRSAWPLLAPALLFAADFWNLAGDDLATERAISVASLATAFGFLLWGLIGRADPQPNRFGIAG